MRVNPKYILIFSDALIPLLGLFVWGWNLYFILLFYMLDLLAREVLTHIKTKGIYKAQGLKNKRKWLRKGVLSGALFMLSISAIHTAVWLIQPDIQFLTELRNFWEYEELGVQQGYILLPLIAYAAYAQYKMTFLMTGKARTVIMDSLWKQHFIALGLILAGATIGALIGSFVQIPDTVSVIVIVVLTGCYNYFIEKI